MIIRPIEPRDYEKVKELHAKSPAKYELPDFEGQNFIGGMVAVDENDEPRVILCFRRTAESYVVIDHDFDVPAYRLIALGELIEASKPRMIEKGYEDAIGTIGPDVPRSYLRRLQRFGCGILEGCTVVKMQQEGK